MLIFDDLNAVIDFIQDGNKDFYPEVKTIDAYKGQLSDAVKNNNVIKLADRLPAVYVILIDSKPLAIIEDYNFDLLIVTESKTFDKKEKHTAALTITGKICNYLKVHDGFNYNGKDYSIEAEAVKVAHLMTDNKYSIYQISLPIKDLK
jgi:hypothetical protein